MAEEKENAKLARQLAWYGVLGGAIISVGAAFLASGISVLIAEITLVPNLFAGDSKAAMGINLLSHFFYFLIPSGGLMIILGALVAHIRIFEKKPNGKIRHWCKCVLEWWKCGHCNGEER